MLKKIIVLSNNFIDLHKLRPTYSSQCQGSSVFMAIGTSGVGGSAPLKHVFLDQLICTDYL